MTKKIDILAEISDQHEHELGRLTNFLSMDIDPAIRSRLIDGSLNNLARLDRVKTLLAAQHNTPNKEADMKPAPIPEPTPAPKAAPIDPVTFDANTPLTFMVMNGDQALMRVGVRPTLVKYLFITAMADMRHTFRERLIFLEWIIKGTVANFWPMPNLSDALSYWTEEERAPLGDNFKFEKDKKQ